MPSPLIQSMAKRANVSVDKVEQAWFDARKEVDGRITDRKDKRYWPQVTAVCQRKLGLREERLTFKEYAELEVSYADAPLPDLAAEPAPEPAPEVVQQAVDPMVTLGAQLACLTAQLFGARDIAHKLHLGTHSFAAHEALKELYELLSSKADEIAEVGMGVTGVPLDMCMADPCNFACDTPRAFIGSLVCNIQDCHMPVFSHRAILNVLEDLLSETFRIKYKLEQLA